MDLIPTEAVPLDAVRIIRPFPRGLLPAQAYSDGTNIDYLAPAETNPETGAIVVPDDALFVMTMAEVLVPAPEDFEFAQHFDGWDPAVLPDPAIAETKMDVQAPHRAASPQ